MHGGAAAGLPEQTARCPGQPFRWLTFCRATLGWDLKMPAATSRNSRPPRTVRDLATLLAKIDAAGLDKTPPMLFQRAVAKAFGFPARRMAPATWTLRREGGALCGRFHRVRLRTRPYSSLGNGLDATCERPDVAARASHWRNA